MGFLLLHSGQASAKRLLKRLHDCTGVEDLGSVASQDIVIRWGNPWGNDPAGRVLNARLAIENTRHRPLLLHILKTNGLRTPLRESDGGGERERRLQVSCYYRIPVFNMHPLACFRSEQRGVWINQKISHLRQQYVEVPLEDDPLISRAASLAVRATYALGLDFSLVSLALSARGFFHVLDVTPAPVLKGRMLELFASAFNNWIEEEKAAPREYHSFSMGADLEFMLRSQQGKMVLASRFLPRYGEVGCDDVSIRRDGQRHPVAELRPLPATGPLELFEHIQDTLQQAKRLIKRPTLDWLAGSMPFANYPIGGHIHFSSLPLSSRLIRALDTYLAFPVLMLEDRQTACRRRPRYGFLGDIRLKSHGGFEYRTPSSWIVSPEITRAVLCLAYLVAVHHRQLTDAPFIRLEQQRLFYQCEKWELQPLFFSIWQQIASTSTYKQYEDQLRIIPDMVQANMSWNETLDIKPHWGIVYRKGGLKKKTAIR